MDLLSFLLVRRTSQILSAQASSQFANSKIDSGLERTALNDLKRSERSVLDLKIQPIVRIGIFQSDEGGWMSIRWRCEYMKGDTSIWWLEGKEEYRKPVCETKKADNGGLRSVSISSDPFHLLRPIPSIPLHVFPPWSLAIFPMLHLLPLLFQYWFCFQF